MPTLRAFTTTALCLALATSACTAMVTDYGDVTKFQQNEGANASVHGVHLRNAYLLGGAPGQSAPAEVPLYAVLINNRTAADRLERITVQGGSVRLAAPVELPPNQPVGTDRPIATVSGLKGQSWIPMTFTFRDAGDVRVQVPLKYRAGPVSSVTPTASPTATH
ncbi:copper chaperone PCu(A)C [Nonomuraea africana]|uniref:Copper(I)-binding protein n=1 Tax=Nonomuraea africana TaxID=46171 RepID=A0ABR9K9V1_9ACTN|nr:hypothetical protein [Nonomuraea africana]MBE1558783.1 copper(I)-binding protein [Nonomuraea africana]